MSSLSSCRKKFHTAECLLQGSVYFSVYHNLSLTLNTNIYIFLHLKCSTHFWSVVHIHKNLSKFKMTYEVYFHAPKCIFNPDPIWCAIWDQKWNYMDPWIWCETIYSQYEYTLLILLHKKYFLLFNQDPSIFSFLFSLIIVGDVLISFKSF